MRHIIRFLPLLLLPLAPSRAADIQALPSGSALATGDLFIYDDISDTSADPSGTTKSAAWSLITSTLGTTTLTLTNKSISGASNTLSAIASSSFANADWGAISLTAGVASVDADVLTAAMMADGDWGAFTIATNSASLDDDVVAPADMADGDFGAFTIATNAATLDDDVVAIADIANGDWGFFSITTNVAALDTGGLTSANLSGALADETGTGLAVFGTSPALTTPTIAGATLSGTVGHTAMTTTLAAAATTLAVTSNFVILTGDGGGNTVATMTGGVAGQRVVILFEDASVTLTDNNSHPADTFDLSAAFTSADDKVLELIFNGTSWYEIARSTN